MMAVPTGLRTILDHEPGILRPRAEMYFGDAIRRYIPASRFELVSIKISVLPASIYISMSDTHQDWKEKKYYPSSSLWGKALDIIWSARYLYVEDRGGQYITYRISAT
jgi:hypothetical protein